MIGLYTLLLFMLWYLGPAFPLLSLQVLKSLHFVEKDILKAKRRKSLPLLL